MTTTVKTQKEFYDIYKAEVTALAPEFTDFSEGSIHDILAGALSISLNEVSELIVNEFSKTFFDLAEGSDLDKLATDHFGETFARPEPVKASGEVIFSRLENSGTVLIPSGTVVKTLKDANGEELRFTTLQDYTMSGLTITAQVQSAISGVKGNAQAYKINTIESPLLDPKIEVQNIYPMAGGKETFTDEEYRVFLKAKILALAGSTESSIKGACLGVAGVYSVAVVTKERVVIDYDIANNQILPESEFFRIPYTTIYVCDESGNSSSLMVSAVKEKVNLIKACGVKIDIEGAQPVSLDWTASLVLNISGPNYLELQSDLTKIEDTMRDFINKNLGIGQEFDRSLANSYILSIWGNEGTGDITSFYTTAPTGNVSVSEKTKLIAGTIGLQ